MQVTEELWKVMSTLWAAAGLPYDVTIEKTKTSGRTSGFRLTFDLDIELEKFFSKNYF